jgi:histone H3/H4
MAVADLVMNRGELLVFQPLPFQRLVREVCQDFKQDYRAVLDALVCMQLVVEAQLRSMLCDAKRMMLVADRPLMKDGREKYGGLEVMPMDMQLARRERSRFEVGGC